MNRIKDLRITNGWTQQDVADKMNTAKSVISRYETGRLGLDAELIVRFCDLFDCTADYLLCRSETRLPAVTDEQARLLEAYQAASLRDRALVDQILAAYMPAAKGKTGS